MNDIFETIKSPGGWLVGLGVGLAVGAATASVVFGIVAGLVAAAAFFVSRKR